MLMSSMSKNWILLVILLVVMTGCGTEQVQVKKNPEVKKKLDIKGAPAWVNNGSRLLATADARLLHGIGSAAPMGDLALQKAVADDRARTEVARVLSSYMDVVLNNYKSMPKSASMIANKQEVSLQIQNATRDNMAGATIIGSWRDKETNTIWSIAELNMSFVKNSMAGIIDMNANFKHYFETSAENIFDRLAKETGVMTPVSQ